MEKFLITNNYKTISAKIIFRATDTVEEHEATKEEFEWIINTYHFIKINPANNFQYLLNDFVSKFPSATLDNVYFINDFLFQILFFIYKINNEEAEFLYLKRELEKATKETVEELATPTDSIKEFPKNVSEDEKPIFNYLADNYHIKRFLTDKGLLPLFGKNGTKELIKATYKHAPLKFDGKAAATKMYNFIKSSIETNLPDSTLQNYCREVKKDIPLRFLKSV